MEETAAVDELRNQLEAFLKHKRVREKRKKKKDAAQGNLHWSR